jgi:hypothetical protein
MWLTVLVDIIAISAGVAIILVAADDPANDTADGRAHNGPGARADARENRPGERTRAGADRGPGRRTGNLVVVGWCRRAAA